MDVTSLKLVPKFKNHRCSRPNDCQKAVIWSRIIARFEVPTTVIFRPFLLSTERPSIVSGRSSRVETNATEVAGNSSTP
jgi:hypothetical protein